MVHGLSCSAGHEIFPDHVLNSCPLRWQVNSYSLDYQGSTSVKFLKCFFDASCLCCFLHICLPIPSPTSTDLPLQGLEDGWEGRRIVDKSKEKITGLLGGQWWGAQWRDKGNVRRETVEKASTENKSLNKGQMNSCPTLNSIPSHFSPLLSMPLEAKMSTGSTGKRASMPHILMIHWLNMCPVTEERLLNSGLQQLHL